MNSALAQVIGEGWQILEISVELACIIPFRVREGFDQTPWNLEVTYEQTCQRMRLPGGCHRYTVCTVDPTELPRKKGIAVMLDQNANESSGNATLVSCIMPTRDRLDFAQQAIRFFARQDYPNRELIIVDDGRRPLEHLLPDDPRIRYVFLNGNHSIGAKRNLACEAAAGEIVLHWDDDDWMASWRIRYQVNQLLAHSAEICGLSSLYVFDAFNNCAWEFVYPPRERPWIAGGTMCYRKSLWRANPFADISRGEDTRFVWNLNGKGVYSLEDKTFYVAMIHGQNTSSRPNCSTRWRETSADAIGSILREDQKLYRAHRWLRGSGGSDGNE